MTKLKRQIDVRTSVTQLYKIINHARLSSINLIDSFDTYLVISTEMKHMWSVYAIILLNKP